MNNLINQYAKRHGLTLIPGRGGWVWQTKAGFVMHEDEIQSAAIEEDKNIHKAAKLFMPNRAFMTRKEFVVFMGAVAEQILENESEG